MSETGEQQSQQQSEQGQQQTTQQQQTTEQQQAANGKQPEQSQQNGKAEPLTAESIKLPDGVEVQPELMTEFVGVMNNDKLSPAERAQALVDLQIKAMNAAREGDSQLWMDTKAQWEKEVKEDPEIGGDKLEGTLSNVAKLIDKYAPGDAGKQLREAFDFTGAGNNPDVIRFLHKVAQELVVEGKPVPGSPGSTASDPATVLYPNMQQGKAS